jgi:hypothetical protein
MEQNSLEATFVYNALRNKTIGDSMDFTKKIIFSDTVFAQEVDGEMVLLDMNSENYFGLDSVASDIWRLLGEGKSVGETYAALLEIYDVEEEQLRADLEAFIQKLLDDGLVSLGE